MYAVFEYLQVSFSKNKRARDGWRGGGGGASKVTLYKSEKRFISIEPIETSDRLLLPQKILWDGQLFKSGSTMIANSGEIKIKTK